MIVAGFIDCHQYPSRSCHFLFHASSSVVAAHHASSTVAKILPYPSFTIDRICHRCTLRFRRRLPSFFKCHLYPTYRPTPFTTVYLFVTRLTSCFLSRDRHASCFLVCRSHPPDPVTAGLLLLTTSPVSHFSSRLFIYHNHSTNIIFSKSTPIYSPTILHTTLWVVLFVSLFVWASVNNAKSYWWIFIKFWK